MAKIPTILLLHAFPHSSKMWESNIAPLSKKYRVIAPDLAGFGKSSVLKEWSMPDSADMIAKSLDDRGIKEPVFVAGLSMGGYMALEFFRRFPERFCGLGLFATRATPDTPEALEKRRLSIDAIEKFGIEPFARKAVKSQLGKTTQEKNSRLVEKVLNFMKEASPQAAINAVKAIAGRRDNSEILPKMKFPALVIAGQEDELCPPDDMKRMADLIPGAEFHVIAGSGHLVNLEQFDSFQKIFEEFLSRKF